MSLTVLLNIVVFISLIIFLIKFNQNVTKLSRKVLFGLVIGVIFGFALQLIYANVESVIPDTLEWTNIIGKGYVRLLYMIVMPLILISMIAAVVRLDKVAYLGKIGGLVVGLLVLTTMISSLVAIGVTDIFGLTAEGLINGDREIARATELESRIVTVADLNLPTLLIDFIPENIFSDLAGSRDFSIISVVIFSILLGIAALQVIKENPQHKQAFLHFIEIAQTIIMKLVHMIMSLTPYGVMALMTNVVASSSAADILNLVSFIAASYIAIAIMFVVHAGLLSLAGVNIKKFFSYVWPVLTFAFTSRSSAACIPLNIEAQVEKLDVPTPIANISASFGATIGQNGCAGIYPTMLALMVAPTVGIDPMSFSFLIQLVLIVTVSSFGVAGVGGGATFAALIVLPAMGLPIEIVALLISIEPLLDMARTALNVNGAITAGVITSRILKKKEDEFLEQPTFK